MAANSPPTTRAAARAKKKNSSGLRGRVLIIGGLVVVIIGLGAYFWLSDGGKKSEPSYTESQSITLPVGPTAANTVGFPGGEISVPISEAVMATLTDYVQKAIVDPLRKGKSDDNALSKIFDATALARLSGVDRAVVLDEDLPRAVGKVSVTSPPVPLTGLGAIGEGGIANVVLISADVQLTVQAKSAQGVVGVTRNGSFVLTPAADGTWKITGWTLTTERSGPGTATNTTTTAGKVSK